MRRLVLWSIVALAGLAMVSSGLAAPARSPEATTYYVGTSPLCDFSSIEDAIAAAGPGDTIQVEDSTFFESPLTVDQDLTLAGGYPSDHPTRCLADTATGYTAVFRTGADYARILQVESATVTVTRTGFYSNANGGGVEVLGNGTLNLEDVFIEDNTASWGGGLRVVNSTANLTDCRIRGNRATFGGGGIAVRGPDDAAALNLTRVNVASNNADVDGGGMYVDGDAQVDTQEQVEFDTNSAMGNGGAIYVGSPGQVTINASLSYLSYLLDNSANGHGGGIYVDGGQVVLNGVSDPVLGERLQLGTNTADLDGDSIGDGGAIYAANGATVEIHDTMAGDNSAENGGAFYVDHSDLTTSRALLTDNAASEDGGGIWAGGGSTVALSKGSRVVDFGGVDPNRAVNGGGIYAEGGASVSLDASLIGGNEAYERGGGVYLVGGSSFVATNGAFIERNYTYGFGGIEGGGIYASGASTEVTIDASHVLSNTAITRGGGLYVGGGAAASIQNVSYVRENKTLDFSGGGGGVSVSGTGSTLSVDYVVLASNHSATHGGGILNEGGMVDLSRVLLRLNDAAESGGGLFNAAGTVYVHNGTSVVENRVINGNGGGLCSEGVGSAVDIQNSWLVGNEAPLGDGGAVWTYRTGLSVHRAWFGYNVSDLEGSAIYVSGVGCVGEPTADVVNSFLVDNQTIIASGPQGPPATGSTLYVEGACATVTHNTLAHGSQQPSFGVYVGDGSTVTLVNNIISGFYTGIRRLSGGTGTATASYPLFYDNAVDYDITGVVVDHPVYGDPAFVGPGDYHLSEPSAAIDAGTDAGVMVDYDGDHRPWDGGYDIGADEYPDREQVFVPIVQR